MKTPAEYRNTEFAGLMIELAKLYKPTIYVELGVKRGYMVTQMAPYVEQVIGVDINPIPVNIANLTKIHSTTLEYAKTLEGREPFIDLLFIDAGHSRESVLEDFFTFLPYVRPGTGLVLLHDTHPVLPELLEPGYCNDAWKAADYIHNLTTLEICTLPGPWAGLSIVRRRSDHHLSWVNNKEGNLNEFLA